MLRWLWLDYMLKLKPVCQKRFQVCRQRPMVLCDLLAQENRIPFSLQVIMIHRKVKDFSLFIVVPILRTIGGKYGVFHRKNKLATWFQPTADFLDQRRKIRDRKSVV